MYMYMYLYIYAIDCLMSYLYDTVYIFVYIYYIMLLKDMQHSLLQQ